MSDAGLALVATGAPFAAFLVALVGMRRRPGAAAATTISGGVAACVAAVALLAAGPRANPVEARWMVLDGLDVAFGFRLDGQNLLMGVVVAVIALLVQVYSVGYMHGDGGRPRYFALMGLFAWSMLSFVYASNLLQTFVFWELVGLASFFLIGFWFEKPEAAAAGRKAFLMTRVGDVGLFVGLALLWQATGTLDLGRLTAPETIAALDPGLVTTIALLLFLGVAGKSAQFPLHTWLPDAMEGPTPVSALLHSATMVAAGVFLFARFQALFLASATATTVVIAVAAFTAILSATVAMVQRDVKRVLAYSSISQLSFMLLGLAAGSLYAGVFHLVTHAFFKALLFLCAGVYIHAHGTNDAVAMGRSGARSLRWTTAGLVAGGAALAGVPPFAGFFSKESILHAVAAVGNPWLTAATFLAVFLTAYYTFRLVFLVTRPSAASVLEVEAAATPGHGGGGGGEGPASMLGPVVLLTAGAVGLGFAGPWIRGLLGPAAELGAHGAAAVHGAHEAHGAAVGPAAWLPAVAVTLAGIALAWVEYGRAGASQAGFLARVPALRTLFARGWYVDDVHRAVAGRAMAGIARACAAVERAVLDRGADGVADATRGGGGIVSRLQSGRLQVYIATALVVATALGWWVARAGGGAS